MDTKTLIEEAQGKEDVALIEMITKIKSGLISFPYQRFYLASPQTMFAELKRSRPRILRRRFKARPYYPFRRPLDYYFQGKPLIVSSTPDCYEVYDALSDHFIEPARIKARRCDSQSPYDLWYQDEAALRNVLEPFFRDRKVITSRELRNALHEHVAEARQFRPSWVRGAIRLIYPVLPRELEVLDISAGWGDRLLACMSLDGVKYTGYDPNTGLISGHQRMINLFGNNQKHSVICQPFEDANLPSEKYDLCISSPPFFDLEHYCDEATQSIRRYRSLKEWLEGFLFSSLRKIWSSLKPGGYLALHMGDTYRFRVCDAMNHFIDEKLEDSHYLGAIGLMGEKERPTPMWVWQKRGTFKRNLFPYSFESMYETYVSDRHVDLVKLKQSETTVE